MMNPEIKAKFLAALRSGTFQQGRGLLRRNDAFCCLGVLCEIMQVPHKPAPADPATSIYFDPARPHEAWRCFLPNAFKEKAGLSPLDEARLSSLNDDGESFSAIADVIEKEL